jgi:predicted Fe-Mo cluster-binding NifX family protein
LRSRSLGHIYAENFGGWFLDPERDEIVDVAIGMRDAHSILRRWIMRVAIPVSDGRVERVFDSATALMVVDLRNGNRGNYFETPLRIRSMRNRAREIAAMRVDVLLCHEISHALESLITAYGIEVRSQNPGMVDEVIQAFVDRQQPGRRPPDDESPALVAV